MHNDETSFDVVWTPPYGGGVFQGPGRWFKIDAGFYWTDDNGHFGLLDTEESDEVTKSVLSVKDHFNSIGYTASQAFDSIYSSMSSDDESIQLIEGDLETLAQEYENMSTTLTAAAPTPEDLSIEASYGITVDEDDSTVLELVKSDGNGTYLRQDESWVNIDPEASEDDYPTVYGTIWYDVSVDAIPVFDDATGEDTITKEIFTDLIINS